MSNRWKAVVLSAAAFLLSFLNDARVLSPVSTEESSRSGALQALEFWTVARAYPKGDISPDGYYRAVMHMRTAMRNVENLPSADTTWQFIGPTNFSGRMISIAVNPLNPNTVYAGAAAGGLWRSYTGGLGADWRRVPTGYPVLGVRAIAIDPADTNTLYIGTGEVYRYQGSVGGTMIRTTRGSHGMGILKTTDGGMSWERSLDWSYNQQRGIQELRLNPQNPRTIFAATSEGVYRSMDAGATWNPTLEVLMARDIVIHPNDTMQVMATCGNFASEGTGVYRSSDGGLNFRPIDILPNYSGMGVFGMYPSNPDLVYTLLADSTISVGTMYRSTDFGLSWTLVADSLESDVQGWYSRFLAVHPDDPNKIVIGAQGLYRSTNGGTTITGVSGGWADYHSYAYDPTDSDNLFMADDGGVWRSTDFGLNFDYVGSGLQTSQFYNGFSSSASDSLRALGQVQDHFGWMYTGTEDWVDGGVDEVGWTAINQSNDFIMYAGSRGGGAIYKSVNRGISYSWSSNGINGGISAWHTPFVLSSSDPRYLYFGRSLIFRSTNSAASWTATNGGVELDGNPALSMAMSYTSIDTVYVGTAPLSGRSHLFRTVDGGVSWTDITGPLPDRYPMDLAVDPTNSAVVYVAFGGFDTSHMYKSADAGGTWVDVTGILPDVPATAVAVDPLNPQVVYAGTDIGVFVSTSGGGDWMVWDEGLPEAVIVSDLSLSPSNRAIRAVTHSGGVYERAMLEVPTTGVAEEDVLTREFRLFQNYPNPFNPKTAISYELSAISFVELKVYDLLGAEVATLVNKRLAPGTYTSEWDATGKSSGIYYYRLSANGFVQTRKLVLLR